MASADELSGPARTVEAVTASGAGAKATRSTKKPGTRKSRSGRGDAHVGQVLRSVYQRAVEEDIPAEMLDLLSKLD